VVISWLLSLKQDKIQHVSQADCGFVCVFEAQFILGRDTEWTLVAGSSVVLKYQLPCQNPSRFFWFP